MRPRFLLVVLCTAVVTACGGDQAPSNDQPPAASSTAPAGPKRLTWGQPAEVIGDGQHKLRITPVGVLYDRGPYEGLDSPENGWFMAVVLKVEALEQPDSIAAPISGGGLSWRGAGQTISTTDGTATSAPWVGSVNEFGVDAPIEPGAPEVGVETFDVPSRSGGRLLYISPIDQTITSWDLPATDQGTGLEKVRRKIKEFS